MRVKENLETVTQGPVSRRRFLGGVLAVSAGAALPVAQAALVDEQRPLSARPSVSKGYHETQHIRDYYKTADF